MIHFRKTIALFLMILLLGSPCGAVAQNAGSAPSVQFTEHGDVKIVGVFSLRLRVVGFTPSMRTPVNVSLREGNKIIFRGNKNIATLPAIL